MQRQSNTRRLSCDTPTAFPFKVLCAAMLSLALVLLASQRAFAANPTWNNTGTNFNADASWDAGTAGAAPDSTEVAIFSGAANLSFLPNLTANLLVSGLD